MRAESTRAKVRQPGLGDSTSASCLRAIRPRSFMDSEGCQEPGRYFECESRPTVRYAGRKKGVTRSRVVERDGKRREREKERRERTEERIARTGYGRGREGQKRSEKEHIVIYSRGNEGNKWFEEPAETGPRTKDTLPASPEPPSSNSGGEKEGGEGEKGIVSEERETREGENGGKADSGGRKGFW